MAFSGIHFITQKSSGNQKEFRETEQKVLELWREGTVMKVQKQQVYVIHGDRILRIS